MPVEEPNAGSSMCSGLGYEFRAEANYDGRRPEAVVFADARADTERRDG